MNHDTVVDLGRRILTHLRERTLDLGAAPVRVPATVFTDPERLAREREFLFRRAPLVVGWAGEVAEPGDFVARDVDGVPVLVTRGDDGVVRAFLNACTHRGMTLAAGADRDGRIGTGCGSARRFTCGYHGWRFDNAGSLTGIPARQQFPGIDTNDLGLRPLPVALSAGLIVVALRENVPVQGTLDELEDAVAGFGYQHTRSVISETFHLRCNWKLTLDINVEGYHIPFLHKATIHGVVLNHGTFDAFGPYSRFCVPIHGFEKLADVPEENWPARLPVVNVQVVTPSTVLIESPSSTTMLRIYPGRVPGESVIHMMQGTWKPLDEHTIAEARASHESNKRVLIDEDFPGAEACQRGFENGIDTMVVGMGESGVAHWHRTWDEAVAKAE